MECWHNSTGNWTLQSLARNKFQEYQQAAIDGADAATLDRLSAEYEALEIACFAERTLGTQALEQEGL